MPSRTALAKIHIAKKALAMSDAVYRRALRQITGEETAKNLDTVQIAKVLNYFHRLGWQPAPPTPRQVDRRKSKHFDDLGLRPGMATPAQLRKIEASWMTGRGIRAKTMRSLRHFLGNRFGVSDPRFIDRRRVTPILAAIKRMNRTTRPSSKGKQPGGQKSGQLGEANLENRERDR